MTHETRMRRYFWVALFLLLLILSASTGCVSVQDQAQAECRQNDRGLGYRECYVRRVNQLSTGYAYMGQGIANTTRQMTTPAPRSAITYHNYTLDGRTYQCTTDSVGGTTRCY